MPVKRAPIVALVCTPKMLPRKDWVSAARTASTINPINHPPIEQLTRAMKGFAPTPQRIAVLTTKYWGTKGVRLTVGFMDTPSAALRNRIVSHLNAWGKSANVQFVQTRSAAQVRIARVGGREGGYWSYLGTDILSIPRDQQTMNLEAFTMETSEAEFRRVVRHEAGHTLGFPHEHMRRALVQLIDPKKAIELFKATQGWTEEEVRQQVLTPIEEASLLGTTADPKSIMCYQIPGSITKNGEPIVGGLDIDASDFAFSAKIYPKTGAAPAKVVAPRHQAARKRRRPRA
jgi:Astacin (Peptidase family M12A)